MRGNSPLHVRGDCSALSMSAAKISHENSKIRPLQPPFFRSEFAFRRLAAGGNAVVSFKRFPLPPAKLRSTARFVVRKNIGKRRTAKSVNHVITAHCRLPNTISLRDYYGMWIISCERKRSCIFQTPSSAARQTPFYCISCCPAKHG